MSPGGERSGPSIGIRSIPLGWCSSMRPGPKPIWRRCGAGRRAVSNQSQGASQPLADHDLHGRLAPRSHHRSMVHRGADQRRSLPSLHREGSGPDPAARRHRHHRQSRLNKANAVRRAIRAAGARLFYLPKYSTDLNPIEQFFLGHCRIQIRTTAIKYGQYPFPREQKQNDLASRYDRRSALDLENRAKAAGRSRSYSRSKNGDCQRFSCDCRACDGSHQAARNVCLVPTSGHSWAGVRCLLRAQEAICRR